MAMRSEENALTEKFYHFHPGRGATEAGHFSQPDLHQLPQELLHDMLHR